MNAQINLLPALTSDRLISGRKVRCSAEFSPDYVYRYQLWRRWDDDKPYCNFILLNPSTATAELDDPTMRRCIDFAFRWGYGAMCTTNIFAFRATDPKVMRQQSNPVGPFNDQAIVSVAQSAGIVICGWGTHGTHLDRHDAVRRLLLNNGIAYHCLGLTADGHPKHPLYLRKESVPIPFV